MKVIVDDKIPYINEAIERIADKVVYAPGGSIDREMVRDADALIVRTRTRCDERLLAGSSVKFIATATIGFDHIDTAYCEQAGITWMNAPGSNSSSVAQYIESCFVLLRQRGYVLEDRTIGIVGVGNVGRKIASLAREYGMRVLLNDPPRAALEGSAAFSSLGQIADEADIITFHTPLNRGGEFKTLHLADEGFMQSLKKKPVIINTSRGEVVDTKALLDAMNAGIIADCILDVWENEPDISKELLAKAMISTPHIAGYSADGKANATRMSLMSLCSYFGRPFDYLIEPPAPEVDLIKADSMDDALLKIYDPGRDSDLLKHNPEQFEWFRGNYPLRREKGAYRISVGGK